MPRLRLHVGGGEDVRKPEILSPHRAHLVKPLPPGANRPDRSVGEGLAYKSMGGGRSQPPQISCELQGIPGPAAWEDLEVIQRCGSSEEKGG